jgi:small redox-active disulfide protein 2
MKLEILGTGCAKCRTLEENTRKAADSLGVPYEIVKVSEIAEIVKRGVMMTPALMVDGQVKSMGKVLTPTEISAILSDGNER